MIALRQLKRIVTKIDPMDMSRYEQVILIPCHAVSRDNLTLAKRARKLALGIEKHFDPEGTPSVLIEEGIAMTYAEEDFA